MPPLEGFSINTLILVIEDEPGIVDFLERGLAAHGFDVLSASDGESGIERALGSDVDLVVLDLMLPGRSGLEVLERLRDTKPGLPVIVLTAQGEVEHRVEGLDAGAADYIVKPFSLSELAARIRAQLRVAAQTPQTTLAGGDIEINLITREVRRDGELGPALDDRVRAAFLPDAQPRSGALAGADPARRVGVRVRPGHQRRRRVHRVPAPQARRVAAPRRRLSRFAPSAIASMRRGSRFLPAGLRWRLTAWVAAVMVISAAAVFVVVYQDTGRQLRSQIDRNISAAGESALAGAAPVLGRRRPRPSPTRRRGTCGRSRIRPARRCCSCWSRAVATVSNHPEVFGGGSAPSPARPEPSRPARTAPGVRCRSARARLLDPARPGRGQDAGARAHGQASAPCASSSRRASRSPWSRTRSTTSRKSFLVAGAVVLVLALIASYLAGARVSAPLRGMAGVAARVDAGDLAPRDGASRTGTTR